MYDPMGFERQPDWYSCGACSFAHAALLLGATLSLDEAQKMCRTVSNLEAALGGFYRAPLNPVEWYRSVEEDAGTDPRGIMRGIVKMGWEYRELETSDRNKAKHFLDSHLAKGHPVILSVQDASHWTTVAGVIGTKYLVIDSAGDDILDTWTFKQLLEYSWYEECEECDGDGCDECSEEGYRYYAIAVAPEKSASTNLLRWLPRECDELMEDEMLQEYWGYYLNDLQYCFEYGDGNTRLVHEFLVTHRNQIVNATSDGLAFVPSATALLELNNYITVARHYGLRYRAGNETESLAYFITMFIGMFIEEYGIDG